MYQRIYKNIIALMFLVAFFAPKIANLHVLSHISKEHDTPISCKICDITASINQFDLFSGDSFSWENELLNIPSSFIVVSKYHISLEKIVSPTVIYNKPPPNVIG